MIRQSSMGNSVLRVGGAFVAIFSLVTGLLVLFVIPSACSFVGSIQMLILGVMFVAGVIAFLFGNAWSHRNIR